MSCSLGVVSDCIGALVDKRHTDMLDTISAHMDIAYAYLTAPHTVLTTLLMHAM